MEKSIIEAFIDQKVDMSLHHGRLQVEAANYKNKTGKETPGIFLTVHPEKWHSDDEKMTLSFSGRESIVFLRDSLTTILNNKQT